MLFAHDIGVWCNIVTKNNLNNLSLNEFWWKIRTKMWACTTIQCRVLEKLFYSSCCHLTISFWKWMLYTYLSILIWCWYESEDHDWKFHLRTGGTVVARGQNFEICVNKNLAEYLCSIYISGEYVAVQVQIFNSLLLTLCYSLFDLRTDFVSCFLSLS